MGNIELKTAFKNVLKEKSQKEKLGVNPEALFDDSLIASIQTFIKNKMGFQELDLEKIFPDNNIQKNEGAGDDIYKKQMIQEFNDSIITGFTTPETNLEFLKEPSFEKYFTVNSPDASSSFTKTQQQKFFVLYALFLEKSRDSQSQKQTFFDFLQAFVEKPDTGNQKMQVGLESGFKFSLSLLKEIKTISKDLLINSLEHLYQTLRYAEPGSLHGTDKLSFMVDANLNDARDFLMSIVEAKDISKRGQELSLKILFMLGVIRSNIEDFLVLVSLLQKHHIQIDLREELSMIKIEELDNEEQTGGVQKQKVHLKEKRVTKTGKIFYLMSQQTKIDINEKTALACDGENIYLHQQGVGLIKLSTGAGGQVIGTVSTSNSEYRGEELASLMFLKGKLYCRTEQMKPAPFVLINPITLEEEKVEFELDKEDTNLEWRESKESGRYLTYTPLITDGEYIYVISQKKAPQKKGEDKVDDNEDSKAPLLILEQYESVAPTFKFIKSTILYRNEDMEPFIKMSNSVDFLKQSSFLTNGQYLYLQTEKKMYCFSMKTGILTSKGLLEEEEKKQRITFDTKNSTFFSLKSIELEKSKEEKKSEEEEKKEGEEQDRNMDYRIQAFTIRNFSKIEPSNIFEKNYLQHRMKEVQKSMVIRDQKNNQLGSLNIVQRVIKNVTAPKLIKINQQAQIESGEEQQTQNLIALIMRFLQKNCQNFQQELDELKSQGKSSCENEEQMMKFFKYPNATYLTNVFFQVSAELLEENSSLIDQPKQSTTLCKQYSFYLLLQVIATNFQALNFCAVSLPLLIDEEVFQSFIKAYKKCIVSIIEKGYKQEFEEGEQQEELKQLWSEIYSLCQNILSTSINLIYEDTKQIIKELLPLIQNIQSEKQSESCSLSLNFLSLPETSKRLLQGRDEDLQLADELYENCCKVISKDLLQILGNIKVGDQPNEQHIVKDPLVKTASKFITGISETLILEFCSLQDRLSSKQQISGVQPTEKEESERQRLRDYENLIIKFFGHTANGLSSIFSLFSKNFKNFLEQNEVTTEQLETFSGIIQNFFKKQSTFFDLILVYVQALSFAKISLLVISRVSLSSISILSEISNYYSLFTQYKDKLSLEVNKDKTRKDIDSFSRNLAWFVGSLAYKLAKVKETNEKDKEGQAEAMHELIIQSNLLAGGVENKFIQQFSEEIVTNVNSLSLITNDQSLSKLLKGQSINESDSAHQLLEAVIQEGRNQVVDKVLAQLQKFLERKVPFVPYARLAGQDGMRMTRAAFALMIKFSEYFDDFEQMIDEYGMELEMEDESGEREAKLIKIVKESPNFEHINKRWENASKMRTWINEKKSNLMERIKKEVEGEFQKKKEEEKSKKKEEKKDEKKEEEVVVKKEGEEEQIDTSSSTKQEQQKAEEKVEEQNDSEFNEEEKVKIEEIAYSRFEQELQSIYTKIIEKAEFLIKLVVSPHYLIKDTSKKSEGGLLYISEVPQEKNDKEGEEQVQAPPTINWNDRFKSWKFMQTSKGAIKSLDERKKEIYESAVTSVLACLQSPISALRIKKSLENVFINACKRVAGLKLFGELIQLNQPKNNKFDLMNWFCSALRGNKNQISHYLDDLKGCGHHLEVQAKENFFTIIKGLVQQLKESDDEEEIKVILNSLKWKYMARDHSLLKDLQIFKVLHEGNEKSGNKLKKVWGRQLKQEVIENDKDKKLNKEVIELFEQIFYLTLGRIIKPDVGMQMQMKQKGTSVPTLAKATSLIDEKVSEVLIGQAFDIMFKEFERYIQIMQRYSGVDWGVYVKQRNKERKDNEEVKTYDDLDLLDEVNTSADSDKKEEDKQEKKEEKEKEKEKEENKNKKKKKEDKDDDEEEEEEQQQEEKDNEGGENDFDQEEQDKQDAIKKIEERKEKELKSLYQIYSESFLKRLLRMLDIFVSITTSSPYPLSMIQKVATPFYLQKLLNLLILSSPSTKIVVLKIMQHLIHIDIPAEVFEETIQQMTESKSSFAYDIYYKIKPSINLEESPFLKFMYQYLLSVRYKMWTKSCLDSEGQFAVSQEVACILRQILENDASDKFQSWIKLLKTQFSEKLLKVEELAIQEVDVIFSIISGGDFMGIQAGQNAITKDNQYVTILGFSDNWKTYQEFLAQDNDFLKKLKLGVELRADNQSIIALFYDPNQKERQEVMRLNLFDVSPLSSFDESKQKKMAESSILNKKEIVTHFLSILKQKADEQSNESKFVLKHLQLLILKTITYMINVRGQDFLEILQGENLLDSFISYLYSSSESDLQQKTLIPIEWVEMKCQSMMRTALEKDLSLKVDANTLSASVLNGKQLIFNSIDEKSKDPIIQNSYLVSGLNMHNIAPNSNFECILEKNAINFNFGSAASRLYGLVFIDGQNLIKMDERALQILLHSQIVLTTSDITPKQLFLKMIEAVREDDKKEEKERKLEGLMETVVLFVRKQDFERVQQPLKLKLQPLFKEAPTQIEGLLRELKEWGDVDRDLILSRIEIKEGNQMNFNKFTMGVIKILKELQDEKAKNKDKVKKLEQEQKFKDIEIFQQKQQELQKKKEKEYEEKKEKIIESLKLGGGGEVESFVKKLVNESIDKQEVEKLDILNVLETDKQRDTIQKIIEKSIKPYFKQEDQDEIKKKSDEQMSKFFFQSVKTFDEQMLPVEYEQTISTLCNLYGKKSLSSIITYANLEQILPALLRDKKNQKLFSCFIRSQFNEGVSYMLSSGSKDKLKQLKKILDKVFQVCAAKEEYQTFVRDFFYFDVIESGIKTVKQFFEAQPSKVLDYFNTEEKILTQLNPYLMIFATKTYLSHLPHIVLARKEYIPNLFNLHLTMALFFQNDAIVIKRIYKSLINFLGFINKQLVETVKNGSLEEVLTNELMQKIISEVDYDYAEKKYSSQQKLLLEIHMKLLDIHKAVLDQSLGQLDSNLESSVGILKFKRGKQVLQEREKFAFLKYYIHYKNMEDYQKDLLIQHIESNHYAYDTKIMARLSVPQVEKLDLSFSESCALKDFTFVGIANNSKGLSMTILDGDQIKKSKKEMSVNKGEFYLFYPIRKQMVIGFGDNQKCRLGNSGNFTGAQMCLATKDIKPQRVIASFWHSVTIDEEGILYKAGQIKKCGAESSTYTKLTLGSKAKLVACGKTNISVVGEDNKVYVMGQSKDGHLGANAVYESFTKFVTDEEDDINNEKIIDIASGSHFSLYVTESGKLYGSGNRFMKEVGIDAENKIRLVPIPDGCKVLNAWASMSKKQPVALIQVENDQGEKLLMSAGKHEQGLLGQGTENKSSKSFKTLAYNYQNIKFKQVSLMRDHAMGITEDGQVYAWGNNGQKRCGFPDDKVEGIFEPKKLEFLEAENLKAIKVSCGFEHSLLSCVDQSTNQERLYSIGADEKNFNHLGITQQEAEDKTKFYREIMYFKGFNILEFTAGNKSSYVIVEGDKNNLDNLYEHTIPGQEKKVKGFLHFYKDEAGQWHYISQSEYEEKKDSLPDLCFAIKCPISDLENRPFPDLNELAKKIVDSESKESLHKDVKCNLSNKEIEGSRYFSFCKINGDDQVVNLCESMFKVSSYFDINPLIYVRVKKPLKQGGRLPIIDLKQFYKESTAYGLDIKVKPNMEYVQNDQLVKMTQSSFDELAEIVKKFPPKCDSELLKEMDKYVKAKLPDKNIGDIKAKDDFKISEMTFKDSRFKKLSEVVKKKRIELYISFNSIFLELMPYIEISKKQKEGSMQSTFYGVKSLILFSIKTKFLSNQINNLPTGSSLTADIYRRKAQRFRDQGKVDHTGEFTIFGQIYQQVKSKNANMDCFRKNNTDDKTWSANFVGEGSIDAGGPYRESISNMCTEIMSESLPLLIKTPNNKNNHGQNRDCYILNPSSTSPTHLDMFKFLGCLIGFGIRTLSALPLNLPPLFWKQVLGEPLEIKDLKGVDTFSWKLIEDLKKQLKAAGVANQEAPEIDDQYFVTRLSDGTEVELCKGGKSRLVDKENFDEYIDLIVKKRLNESEMQMNAVREGIEFVIPIDMIRFFTWEEVENRACGDKIIDTEKLKGITVYSGCTDKDEIIKRFWRVFEEFTNEEKSLYLKFVWGRARLPADLTKLRYKHTLRLFKQWDDTKFPEAHTCFFYLDLPNYSTDEICREKILKAITMCGEIDTDGDARWINDDNDE